MSKLILFSLLVLSAGAQAMINSRSLSCAEAEALVQQQGAILLQTSATNYDRYVVNSNFCFRQERLVPAWVPTLDTSECFVGYTCSSVSQH